MGCPSMINIESDLVFTITTHDPATAALTDAASAPAYRLYEDEVAVPLLTGNMALLDAVNTTGFYSETVACTTANGFLAWHTYNIYIEATVGGVTGGISYSFTVVPDLCTLAALAMAEANIYNDMLRGQPVLE